MPDDEQTDLEPTPKTQRLVWAAAAGRCTFCNSLVTENEPLGLLVPIGELAHMVGRGVDSPRGDSEMTAEERRQPDNLVLACRNCHKPVDDGGIGRYYTIDELRKIKRGHEERIRFLTEIGGDRRAAIIRVVGSIRGSQPELSYATVLDATTAAGYFPQWLPGAHRNEYDLDLRQIAAPTLPEYFAICGGQASALLERVNDGVRRDDIQRLAVFAFARIPILVKVGACLDDKVETLVFQRQRTGDHPWRWPESPGNPVSFEIQRVVDNATDKVALVVNLSGTGSAADLPEEVRTGHTVFEIRPASPAEPSPELINSRATLANFETTAREFLARMEADFGRTEKIALFGAIPISAAITLGRILMPGISPAWAIYERDDQGRFFEACEVRR